MWFRADGIAYSMELRNGGFNLQVKHDMHSPCMRAIASLSQYFYFCGNALLVSWWRMLNGDPYGMKWAMMMGLGDGGDWQALRTGRTFG